MLFRISHSARGTLRASELCRKEEVDVGGLFMGLIGCGHVIASKTMEAATCAVCLMGNLYSDINCVSDSGMSVDVARMISLDPVNKMALVVGIVIGVNYMNLVNMYRRKKRRKHGRTE